MKIIWSPLTVDRVVEIAQYISEDDAEASRNWVDSVFNKVEQINAFPRSGRIVPETNREHIREILFGNYRIIYRIDKEHVSILTVRHGKQILPIEGII